MPQETANKPAHEIKFGAVKVTIWQNETKHGPRFNTVLARLYKNGDGKWQTTDSLGRDDLLAAAMALQRAFEWVHQAEENARVQDAPSRWCGGPPPNY